MGRRFTHPADTAKALAADLAVLPRLPRESLKARWQEFFGAPPPSRLGRALMVRAIAYRLQEQALGGLDATTLRQLARIADDLAAGRAALGEISERLARDDMAAFETQGRFIQSRYGTEGPEALPAPDERPKIEG